MTVATLDPTPLTGKSLFSQHYLEARLPDHPEWAEDPGAAFDAVRALWQRAQQLGDAWNEAQTEEEFVRPALTVLGWSYIPQVKNSRSGRVNRPDYALFPDEAARDAAYPHQGQDDAFYGRALAIYKGDFALAKACFERVIELDPGGTSGVDNISRARKFLSDSRLESIDLSSAEFAGLDALQRRMDEFL